MTLQVFETKRQARHEQLAQLYTHQTSEPVRVSPEVN